MIAGFGSLQTIQYESPCTTMNFSFFGKFFCIRDLLNTFGIVSRQENSKLKTYTLTWLSVIPLEKPSSHKLSTSVFVISDLVLEYSKKKNKTIWLIPHQVITPIYSLFSNVMCTSVSLLHWSHVCTGKYVLCLKASGSRKQSHNYEFKLGGSTFRSHV